MESIKIDNTTYLVRRVFVGKKPSPNCFKNDYKQIIPNSYL